MSDRILLEEVDGITEYLVFHNDDTFTVEREFDAQALIDMNKHLYDEGDRGWSPSKEWRRVASFPPHMREYFIQIYGADPFLKENEALLNRILNDPDLKYFRTAPGVIA
ncbi:MAG: hypothetical protein OK436_06660 [Thaumarchaeota archaeon]|nr:hypothetical protein [Nitrososphaerota archaeon]